MPMKKVCPRCGATFDCMHNDILSCHCATVRLDALQRTYLMENYSDCLCHDCLKAVKDSFYACEINPRYNKKKNDKGGFGYGELFGRSKQTVSYTGRTR